MIIDTAKFLILVIVFIGCAVKKPSMPRNAREAHIFKYTDLAVQAQLNGKLDSVEYYLHIAMSYDSIYQVEWYSKPIKMNIDTIPVSKNAPLFRFSDMSDWRSDFSTLESTEIFMIQYGTKLICQYALRKDTMTINCSQADELFKRTKTIIVAGKIFHEATQKNQNNEPTTTDT